VVAVKKSIFVLAIAASLLAANPVYAAAQTHQYSEKVDNNISTGDIDITLEELELDANNNMVAYNGGDLTSPKTVFPGQTVSKIIRITNNAETAWIRTQAEFQSSSGMNQVNESMLKGISSDWVKRGGYYYYTKPVKKGDKNAIYFFKEVVIPSTWTERDSEKQFQVDITAQAIQTKNFNPDFDSSDPWFGKPIEECIHSDHDSYQADEHAGLSITFKNGVDGFIKSKDDFFLNFSAMMPGDTLTDSFELGNNFRDTLPIYFRTEVPEGQSEDALDLLSQLALTISSGDEEIYKGPLSADDLFDEILLTDLAAKGTKTITFSVYMPEELQNAYALRDAQVEWIFGTDYDGDISQQNDEPETTVPQTTGSGGGGGGGGGSDDVPSTTSPSSTEGTKATEPATDPATEPATDPEKPVYPDLPDVPVNPDGTPDIPEGTPIEIYDPANPDEPVYRGPYSDDINLPPGTYEIVMLDENGVPLASGIFTIDDEGVPRAFKLAATGDYSTNIYLLLAIALISGSMVLILAMRLRNRQGEEDSDDKQN
jgi:hypothetical protein